MEEGVRFLSNNDPLPKQTGCSLISTDRELGPKSSTSVEPVTFSIVQEDGKLSVRERDSGYVKIGRLSFV